jgi:hypothetical protein
MHDKTGVRWVRVIIAGLLTEISVVLLIVIIVSVYKYALSPAEADYQSFASRVGLYVGVIGGALMAFLFSLWANRSLKADFLVNGFLVGCIAAILHIGLFVASGAGFQMVYVLADALKLCGGTLGGYLAQRKYKQSASALSTNHAA